MLLCRSILRFFPLLLAISTAPALAQSPDSGTPAGDEPSVGLVELADEPFHLDAVGLTMRLPVGTIAQSSNISGRSTIQLTPPMGKGDWSISIEVRRTSNKDTTIEQTADLAVASLQTAYGTVDPDRTVVTETFAQVLDRSKGLVVNGSKAERFYISLPVGTGSSRDKPENREVRGFTFFKPTASDFVIFELQCPLKSYKSARSIYETTLATASFQDASAVAMARGAAITAGSKLFNALTPADYIAAMGVEPGKNEGPEVMYRLYRPAKTGADADAEEFGYRVVKFWRGKRGELDSEKTASSYSRTEQQEGLLARIRGRVLTPVGIGDTEGIYFMSPDRSEEAWSVRTAVRDAKNRVIAVASETGARSGSSLTVVIDEQGKPSRSIQPVLQEHGEGYISQVETYLLPQLLMLKQVAGEYGFYTYQSQSGSVSLRRDTLRQDPKAVGAWTLETIFREGGTPQKSVYTEDGRLVRSVLEDGRIWEPMDADELLRLWKKKGLPTGK